MACMLKTPASPPAAGRLFPIPLCRFAVTPLPLPLSLPCSGYSEKKISENVQCEIMMVVMEEASESYRWGLGRGSLVARLVGPQVVQQVCGGRSGRVDCVNRTSSGSDHRMAYFAVQLRQASV